MRPMLFLVTFILLLPAAPVVAQQREDNASAMRATNSQMFADRLSLAAQGGVSVAYADRAYLFSFPLGVSLDYHLGKGYSLQLAPKYSWVYKWNEHYITFPFHLRKQFGESLSLFAGPAMTWDVGHFRDLGLSAGIIGHLTPRSSVMLSVFTFTLYDYEIDYRYITLGISYNFYLFR